MTVTTTYDWIKHLPQSLLGTDSSPLLGTPPPFPKEAFSAKLSEALGIPHIKVETSGNMDWHPPEEILNGLGSHPQAIYATLVPALPPLCWIMPAEDINTLAQLLLSVDKEFVTNMDPEFRKGFYQFLAMEALNALTHVDFDKTLAPQIQEKEGFPQESSLCLDIALTVKERTLSGRLVLSPAFKEAWQERYTPRSMDIPKPLLSHINATIACEIGRTTLKLSEWNQVELGDFIVLDSCSLKPSGEGRIVLTLNGKPIFRGKLKDGNIKILEHPLYNEEEKVMASSKEPEFEEEEEEESDFEEEDLEEEIEDALADEEEVEEGEEDEAEAAHKKVEAATPAAAEPAKAPGEAPAAPLPLGTKKPFSAEDIPLSVVVELGRVQMSLQKVIDLQPGNLLELNVRPENGVDLVINGKRIAKGELLMIGETLGVRVLDIG